MTVPVGWDAEQYDRYADHRGRPFHELIDRVVITRGGLPAARTIVDLGCGPGGLTASLPRRFPEAQVLGVDNSPDMLATANDHSNERLSFERADIATWTASTPVDLIVSNAAFQWVPGHINLIPKLAAQLADNGTLAFQVPDNFTEPSHTLLLEHRRSKRWRDKVGAGADRELSVERPKRYLEVLHNAGLDVDVWQANYFQVLPGDDAVLEWMKGTALRPVVTALDPDEAEEFMAGLAVTLAAAYPKTTLGTVMPFRRTFAIGQRR